MRAGRHDNSKIAGHHGWDGHAGVTISILRSVPHDLYQVSVDQIELGKNVPSQVFPILRKRIQRHRFRLGFPTHETRNLTDLTSTINPKNSIICRGVLIDFSTFNNKAAIF
jgi:hypothetical protein